MDGGTLQPDLVVCPTAARPAVPYGKRQNHRFTPHTGGAEGVAACIHPRRRLSSNWLTIQGPQPTAGMEWVWLVARVVVVLAVAAGAVAFLADNSAKPVILGGVYFVLAYDLALGALIQRGRVATAFRVGFALDHIVLLTVWWLTVRDVAEADPNDLYLMLFPIVVIGVVRVGWVMGVAYTILLVGWMAWADLRYQPVDSYPIEQLPLRAAFLVLVAALTSVLVFQLQSARRRAERERETLASVQRSMAEGLIVVDNGGDVQFYNPAATALLGTPADTPDNMPFEELVKHATALHETAGLGDDLLRLVQSSSMAPQTLEATLDRADRRHCAFTVFPIAMEEEGTLTGLLVRDVTEQWEMQQRQYSFVSIAAHELRTPLTAVMGFSELLQTRSPSDRARTEWLGHINAESHRLTAILDELMSVSRIQSGKTSLTVEQLDFAAIVDDVITACETLSPSRQFQVSVPATLPDLWADGGKVKQVLLNLMSNAIKYSPAGDPVRLTARVDGERGELVIDVADNGVGIPSHEHEKLFTTFYRVRTSATEGIRGTGLGLYICKGIVELMGGRIWMVSAPDAGSTFSFSLPLGLEASREQPVGQAKTW